MKLALALTLLAATGLWADEAANRSSPLTSRTTEHCGGVSGPREDAAASCAAIAATLSRLGENQPALFTSDFADAAELNRVLNIARVVISKEPFGEATIVIAPQGTRFVIQSTRLLTADVALVDAQEKQDGTAVLLVMKKEGIDWRVAAFRKIAANTNTAP